MPGTTDPADGTGGPGAGKGALGSLGSLLRPELADLTAYVPDAPDGIEVKLDANEAPSPSAAVREAVVRAIASVALERYPDPRALRLKDAIAKRTGARPADLLVGGNNREAREAMPGCLSGSLAFEQHLGRSAIER